MSYTTVILQELATSLIERALQREPDVIIGGKDDPYLLRWHLIPRNPLFNVYLHCFLRSDDDRALHDHPWLWCSVLLRGGYIEHTIAAGGVHRRDQRLAPSVRFALPTKAHRVELIDGASAWSLFVTGPRVRQWGFHCPERGWVHWKEFTSENGNEIGPGCDGEVTA